MKTIGLIIKENEITKEEMTEVKEELKRVEQPENADEPKKRKTAKATEK